MRIGITDTFNEDKYDAYVRWVQGVDPGIELLRLSHRETRIMNAGTLEGVILTGGGDVHPGRYGRADAVERTAGIDEERDAFEFDLVDRTLDHEIPILGVCRGMQVMNVALGGTLVVDLPTDGFMEHRSRTAEPLSHPLAVVPHTLLHALAGTTGANVNSFHHQAVDVLGQGLVRSAISSDGVTEAAEWAIKDGMSFLLLVQWHPERAPGDALSQNIMKMFLREVRIVHSDYSHH